MITRAEKNITKSTLPRYFSQSSGSAGDHEIIYLQGNGQQAPVIEVLTVKPSYIQVYKMIRCYCSLSIKLRCT